MDIPPRSLFYVQETQHVGSSKASTASRSLKASTACYTNSLVTPPGRGDPGGATTVAQQNVFIYRTFLGYRRSPIECISIPPTLGVSAVPQPSVFIYRPLLEHRRSPLRGRTQGLFLAHVLSLRPGRHRTQLANTARESNSRTHLAGDHFRRRQISAEAQSLSTMCAGGDYLYDGRFRFLSLSLSLDLSLLFFL